MPWVQRSRRGLLAVLDGNGRDSARQRGGGDPHPGRATPAGRRTHPRYTYYSTQTISQISQTPHYPPQNTPPPHIFTAKYTSISTYRPTPFSFWVPYTPHHHYKSRLGYPSAPRTWGRGQTGLYSVPLLVILCSKYGGSAWIFLRNGL